MRIGVIASMKRGLEQFIYREVGELYRLGAQISIFPTKQGPGLYEPPAEWNVVRWKMVTVLLSQASRLLSFRSRYFQAFAEAIKHRAVVDFLLAAYFAKFIRAVDVIYATFGDRKLFVGYFCSRLTGKPLAVEIHAYELYQNPNPSLFPVALAHCDQIITVSDFNREFLRDRYQIESDRVDVIRYSIDLREYKPAKKLVVLIVAFFVEKKGHEVLFEAIKKLERDDVEVWVVGGTGGSSAVVDVPGIVERLRLEDQVAFFGKLRGTALKAVYRECDVFCLPSRVDRHGDSEGFPNVIVEAMACGKPVVTTRHVEIPRIVEKILVDENDVDGLADGLSKALESASLREEMGRRNRELAEIHFSSRNVQDTHAHLARIATESEANEY
jgi:glycosyltransferase involved in cell wall biosynthesis